MTAPAIPLRTDGDHPADHPTLVDTTARIPSTSFRRLSLHHVKLDPMDESALVDRARVGRPISQGLTISLSRSGEVVVGHSREGQHLERVDLDDDPGSPIAATNLDLRPIPQPDRDCDLAAYNGVAKVSTEHHLNTLGPLLGNRRSAPTVASAAHLRPYRREPTPSPKRFGRADVSECGLRSRDRPVRGQRCR